jgi:hypothetical protein
VDAALAIDARIDSGDMGGRRELERLSAAGGVDFEPRIVERAKTRIESPAKIANLIRIESVRRIEKGKALPCRLALPDQRCVHARRPHARRE